MYLYYRIIENLIMGIANLFKDISITPARPSVPNPVIQVKII